MFLRITNFNHLLPTQLSVMSLKLVSSETGRSFTTYLIASNVCESGQFHCLPDRQ